MVSAWYHYSLGVASYQLQEVYERTLLEIKQEASEENTSEEE